jgi:YcaO-like protein with predicted kinase domain
VNQGLHKVTTTGTHRCVPLEVTYSRALASAARCGLTRVADITGLDTIGIPVAAAYRPNARSLSVSQGKGLDILSAKVSALMEGIELWHAESVRLPLLLGTEAELRRGRRVVDTSRLPRTSLGDGDPQGKLLWVAARDVSDGEECWVPLEMVHADYTAPVPTGGGCFLSSSSGLASGNHPMEATLHALYELIERDAAALWQGRRGSRANTRLDLGTVDDPECRRLLELFEQANAPIAAWNITSDLGLPAFYAEVAPSESCAAVAAGQGCHCSRAVALARALTEAAQSRLTVISGARDDLSDDAYSDTAAAPSGGASVDYRSIPSLDHDTLDQDLDEVMVRLARCGLEQVLVVNLSHAEVGLPVVRVVVPGLEGMIEAPGYLPGPRARQAWTDASSSSQAPR